MDILNAEEKMFAPGNTVRLKSGGPLMTVERLVGAGVTETEKNVDHLLKSIGYTEGDPICVWFEDNNVYHKPLPFTKDTVVLDDGTASP